MNVIDSLKNKTTDEIKNYCYRNMINASVGMMQISGDFNLSTLVRNANFFGFEYVHYIGNKKWDRRGSVGTHHYTDMVYHKCEKSFIENIREQNFTLIGVENNIPDYSYKTFDIFDLDVVFDNPLFLFGEERLGLNKSILDICDHIITIPNHGSVRSLNVGTASGIIMGLYRNLYEKRIKLTDRLVDVSYIGTQGSMYF